MKRKEETLEEASRFVKAGGLCRYRYGWAYRGAEARKLDGAKALEYLAGGHWRFGIGFYGLSWQTDLDGRTVLEFNELSENDML